MGTRVQELLKDHATDPEVWSGTELLKLAREDGRESGLWLGGDLDPETLLLKESQSEAYLDQAWTKLWRWLSGVKIDVRLWADGRLQFRTMGWWATERCVIDGTWKTDGSKVTLNREALVEGKPPVPWIEAYVWDNGALRPAENKPGTFMDDFVLTR